MTKSNENLIENGLQFTRVYCLDGHIDICFTDSSCDPNKDHRPNYNLNSYERWFRFNENKWINQSEFKPNFGIISIITNKNLKSIEIFNKYKK